MSQVPKDPADEPSGYKCPICNENITKRIESTGVHLCPKDGAYHNVGEYLKQENVIAEKLKKEEDEKKAENKIVVEAPKEGNKK